MPLYYPQVISTQLLRIIGHVPLCSLPDSKMYDRVSSALVGVIDHEFLFNLRPGIGILSPQALIIMEIYNHMSGMTDSDAQRQLESIKHICEAEALKPVPTNDFGKVSFHVNKFALKAMCYCQLRVGENNQSTCSGNMAVTVQFFFIAVLDQETVRV